MTAKAVSAPQLTFSPPGKQPDSPGVAVVRIPAPVLTVADIPPVLGQAPAMLEPARLWTVTPDIARCIKKNHEDVVEMNEIAGLKRTGQNRGLRWAGTDNYSRDMKAGNWLGRNGETIKITWKNIVADGQHRLEGCIRADTAFETFIVFGVDLEAQRTIDTGLKRQFHDELTMQGEPNAKALETTARWAWRWVRGARSRSGSAVPKPTAMELAAFIENDERLKLAANWGLYAYRESDALAKPSVFSMGWLIFYGINDLAAQVFLEGVATGANLSPGHPALTFRKRMTTAQRRDERLTEHEQLCFLIMAWNAFRAERSVNVLSLPAGGLKPHNFPEPR